MESCHGRQSLSGNAGNSTMLYHHRNRRIKARAENRAVQEVLVGVVSAKAGTGS